MKQLQFETGGRPVANDDFVTLQQELTAAIFAPYAGCGPFILSGCQVSGTAASADITPGIVCLDGQLLRFAGVSGVALPAQFQAGATVGSDPRPYQTGGTKDCMKEVPAVLESLNPNYSGQYLVVELWGAKRWAHVLKEMQRTPFETQYLGSGAWRPNDYDVTGRGKPGTEAWGWHLANTNAGTDFFGGLATVGLLPSATDYDTPGKTGGAAAIVLQPNQLPRHDHGGGEVLKYTPGTGNADVSGGNQWSRGSLTPVGSGAEVDIRSPYVVQVVRQWVGY